jgi:hypothetical protein
MKQAGAITTAVLFLFLGTTTLAYAQREQQGRDEGRSQQGQQHQQGRPEGQPQQRQQANKPAQRPERPQSPYGSAYHGGVKPNGPTIGGVHHSGVPQHQGQVQSGFGQSRARSWNDEHRTWGQRGGYNGYRVPEDRFRGYWGRPHPFRIYTLPLLFVGGYPRFRYDGYWVTLVDPWPNTWPANWYQTDDVYVDYTDDGYYLYDLTRPSPALAVTITF